MNNSLPTLMALRCFDASVRLGSFTKAADEVCLTQGAVSHQILGLEDLLGVTLFLRKRNGLEVTGTGRAYWDQVSVALRQIERATQDTITNKGRGGTLNLCVASSFASYWLIPKLPSFVSSHPEVTLNLSTRIGPVDFSTTNHDASIEYCEGPTDQLQAIPVLPLVLQPYAAPVLAQKYSRQMRLTQQTLTEMLLSETLIRQTTVPQAWPSWLRTVGILGEIPQSQLHSGPQYDLLSMALNGAIGGIGIALLPSYIAHSAIASKQLVLLSSKAWTSDSAYYLRFPRWKADLAAVRTLRLWLESIAENIRG